MHVIYARHVRSGISDGGHYVGTSLILMKQAPALTKAVYFAT